MCGIIAYLGTQAGGKIVLEGIKILRNRGYDSMGCASIGSSAVDGANGSGRDGGADESLIRVTKWASVPGRGDSFEMLASDFEQVHGSAHCAMAHCRWATTGIVNDVNSHPHVDTINGRIALVHNGIISNYHEVKKFLTSEGVKFVSETDTEVIVNLIAYYYHKEDLSLGGGESGDGSRMSDAIKMALAELEGTWAIVVMNADEPESLYVSKKGSPVVIGYSGEVCIISSEVSGFSNYLKNYHVMPDDHILRVRLSPDSGVVFERDGHMEELSSKQLVSTTIHATSPDPYPHWTLKEIQEQGDAAFRALNRGGRLYGRDQVRLGGLREHQDRLAGIRHLTLIASGTSRHAALIGERMFRSMGQFEMVQVIEASEFTIGDLGGFCHRIPHGVLMLSQSGETRDVYNCLEMIREARPEIVIFSIVNVVESLIARSADCGVYLNAGREVGVASTKSFTNQVIVLALLAIWFAQVKEIFPVLREKMVSSLHNLPGLITETLVMMKPACASVIEKLIGSEHMFLLGKDRGFPVALEGALKIKEISYIHAEAYQAGGLKHGPLALISSGTPVIVILEGDTSQIRKLEIAAEEVKSRGAYVIAVTSNSRLTRRSIGMDSVSTIYDAVIPIAQDRSGLMYPILSNLPLQYLAYLLAVRLGHNVDYPRNLAKCVTTD